MSTISLRLPRFLHKELKGIAKEERILHRRREIQDLTPASLGFPYRY